MKESILIFEVNNSVMKQRLRQALMPLKLRLKYVSPSDYDLTIGEIAGLGKNTSASFGTSYEEKPELSGNASANSASEIIPPPETSDIATQNTISAPMLVFVGLSGEKLDAVLANMRKKSIRIPYKAVLTPVNQNWRPYKLFGELCREHELMTRK